MYEIRKISVRAIDGRTLRGDTQLRAEDIDQIKAVIDEITEVMERVQRGEQLPKPVVRAFGRGEERAAADWCNLDEGFPKGIETKHGFRIDLFRLWMYSGEGASDE